MRAIRQCTTLLRVIILLINIIIAVVEILVRRQLELISVLTSEGCRRHCFCHLFGSKIY